MKKILFAACCFTIFATPVALAGDEVKHFPALESPDIQTALCNLEGYNQKLVAISSKSEISAEEMVKVHELTYTLENALIKLSKELEVAAQRLEEVHKASEHMEPKIINNSGKRYLDIVGTMFSGAKCQ